MSAFLDLQNKIRKSSSLPGAEKMEMLSLLGEMNEESVKTINELAESTCRSVTSAVVSIVGRGSMTLSKWLSSTKALGGNASVNVCQGGETIPLSSMSESEREEALGSDGWCQVSQLPPSKMTFTWVRKCGGG